MKTRYVESPTLGVGLLPALPVGHMHKYFVAFGWSEKDEEDTSTSTIERPRSLFFFELPEAVNNPVIYYNNI